ncbi:hypothetical protein ACET3Z_031251 [Daucus carota]
MEMKQMACAALVTAASMSAVLAQAPVEVPAESPLAEGPTNGASAALPALGIELQNKNQFTEKWLLEISDK